MKGEDCTPEQIEAARWFLAVCTSLPCKDDSQHATLTFGDLMRVIAWYGALRYIAGRDGDGGTLDAPGELMVAE